MIKLSKRKIRIIIYLFISIIIGYASSYILISKVRTGVCEDTTYGFPFIVFRKGVQYIFEQTVTGNSDNVNMTSLVLGECGWGSGSNYIWLLVNIAFYFVLILIVDLVSSMIIKAIRRTRKK